MSGLQTVAIIGVGRAGLQHARAATALGLTVSAYSSLTERSDRAKAFESEFPSARRIEIDDPRLCDSADLLVVALPPEVAHDAIVQLVKNCRQLLVEKPLALSTSRIELIAQIATKSGCKVTVGYNRRMYPAVVRLREVLESDPPRTVEVTIVEDPEFIVRTKGMAFKDAYLRHGASTHMLDLSGYLFGRQEVGTVRAMPSSFVRDFVDYFFESRSAAGFNVTTTIDAGDRARRGIRIVTRDGRELVLAPLEHLRIGAPGLSSESNRRPGGSSFDYPSSYHDSFVTQMRLLVEGRDEELHGVSDSLSLSKIVDVLEVASGEFRHE